MTLRDLPILRYFDEIGPEDPGFDLLLLAGPIVIGLIALLGRTIVTELVAFGYVLAFLTYVAYRAVIHE